MAGHDIIVIGASAGGVEALMHLVRDLPRDLHAAVFIVLHVSPEHPSRLPEILTRSGPLPAHHPEDGEQIHHGRIYVAPPDMHLLVDRDHVRVVRGPRENRHRPAVDPLFRSAALAYGSRVIGVVLTGALDDGTAGLLAVKQRGGVAVVQEPREAFYPSMPRSAIENVAVDYILPLAAIPSMLTRLVDVSAPDEGAFPVPDDMDFETRIASMDPAAMQSETRPGKPSVFSCPECKGVLYEIYDGDFVRYRCRVGHAFTPDTVLAEQSEAIEEALWMALNILDESASLSRRLAQQAEERGQEQLAKRFNDRRREVEQRAEVLRQVLRRGDGVAAIEQTKDEDLRKPDARA